MVRSSYDDTFIEETIEKYSNMVYRLCIVYLKNRADAEDAFQEVFIKIIEKAPTFLSEEHQKAWIITVTSNHCKNILSKRKRHITYAYDENIITYNDPKEKEILPIILNLPLEYRNVIYLYYYEGYSTKEISDILKKNDATVRTWLRRARASLKIRIGGAFDD